jgi:hypothetical protein
VFVDWVWWSAVQVLLLAYILHRWRTRRSQAAASDTSAAETSSTAANAGDIWKGSSNGRSPAAGPVGGRHSSKYSGRVWTMPVAALPASGAVEVFPPATVDQGGAAFEWQASCHKGVLTLRAVTPAAAVGVPAKVGALGFCLNSRLGRHALTQQRLVAPTPQPHLHGVPCLHGG